MENTTSKCLVCGSPNTNKDTGFCSDACFEIWWEQMEAQLLLRWIELELKLSDAKPC